MKRPVAPLGCQVIGFLTPELLGPEWSPNGHMPITGHGVAGAAGRNRTCDPLLRREMLYPLSYSREARQCIKG